jgi:hypothetical protein
MSWHHLARESKHIESLYGDVPPSLQQCRIHRVLLGESRDLTIVLDVTDMPPLSLWPSRWDQRCNRVVITLRVSELSSVRIKGWSAHNVADVDIRRASDERSVTLVAQGAWGSIEATGGSSDGAFQVVSVTAHRVDDAAAERARWASFVEEHLNEELAKLGMPAHVFREKSLFDHWLMHGRPLADPSGFAAEQIRGASRLYLLSLIRAYLNAGFGDPGITILSKFERRRLQSGGS